MRDMLQIGYLVALAAVFGSFDFLLDPKVSIERRNKVANASMAGFLIFLIPGLAAIYVYIPK